MSAGWDEVCRWDPAPLAAAAAALGTDVQAVVAAGTSVEQAPATPRDWNGQAADAARARQLMLATQLRELAAEAAAARRALETAADAVAGVVRAVREVQAFAAARQLRIVAGRVVADDRFAACMASVHDERLAAAQRRWDEQECMARVAAVLRQAADADADLDVALRLVASGRVAEPGLVSVAAAAVAGTVAGAGTLLPPPAVTGGTADPASNAAWWAALSDGEREEAITGHPEWVGARDGVDAAARDRANRILLPRLRADLLRQRADLDARIARLESGGATRMDRYGALALRQQRDGLDAKVASVDQVARILAAHADRQLLLLDVSRDRAEAAIAVGDVGTAAHVTVFTPGLTSTVQGIVGNDRDMASLKRTAEGQLAGSAAGTVAAVTWLGYQAPQVGTVLSGNSVALPGAAQDGGRRLAQFLRGISVARDAPADLTALGHSYGSTTLGSALTQDTGVSRAAFFGSPGLGVDTADALHVPAAGMYYAEAAWDGVGDLGRFGPDPTALDGITHLETGEATASGTRLEGITLHTSYLNERTTSQYNLAAVVSGRTDLIVQGRGVGIGDLLGSL